MWEDTKKELLKAKSDVDRALVELTFSVPVITVSDLRTTDEDSGFDLRYISNEPAVFEPFETKVLPTGVRLAMFRLDDFQQYEAQVRPRSSISKRGLLVHLGTVDWGYRGEVGVIITNLTPHVVTIEPNERIAQMVFNVIVKPKLVRVEKLDETKRGEKGFGSTGSI